METDDDIYLEIPKRDMSVEIDKFLKSTKFRYTILQYERKQYLKKVENEK